MHTPPILIKGMFSDADSFCAAGVGWDVDFRQLDGGTLAASLEVVAGPGLAVQRLHLDRRFHQRGCPPPGVLTFGLPNHSRILSWHGTPLPRPTLVNFNRRGGFDSVSETGFTAQTFSIAEGVFQDATKTLGIELSSEQIADAPDIFDITPIALERIRGAADNLFGQSQFGSTAAEFTNSELQDELVLAIAAATGEIVSSCYEQRYSQRQRVVNRALDYINSKRDAVSIRDLYRVSRSSWRTLDRGFQERFGVTPKKYIIATRLVGARRTLQASPPETRIADIAGEWGFAHLGRFSTDYRQMFGERPSDTLKNWTVLSNRYRQS